MIGDLYVNTSRIKYNGLIDEAASFIATFPLAAIRKGKLEVGESILIMGLGIFGQFGVKLARAAGADLSKSLTVWLKK